jgi:hypothetical protein
VQTIFFAATAGELLRLAAAGGDPTGLDLAFVDAGDLDPVQLVELDLLVTGHDPELVREAVLTPAGAVGGPVTALAQGTEERVVLSVRTALCRQLRQRSDARLDQLALGWELRSWGTDWTAPRYAQLLRSLSLLADLGRVEHRGVYVRFDV